MSTQIWGIFIATFLASAVECVEAFTIVLVVGVTINWRSAFLGTVAAFVVLALLVGIFGPTLLYLIPLNILRIIIGFLLVLFGLKWLKKALLRYAGIKPLHDEEAIYEAEVAEMQGYRKDSANAINKFGVALAFKGVLLEGLEVAFIVITFGIQTRNFGPAILGALAAAVSVAFLGVLIHSPLRQVPENTLKFIVGIMLTSFGTFWAGEGFGIPWWHEDFFIFLLILTYLFVSYCSVFWLRTLKSHAKMLP